VPNLSDCKDADIPATDTPPPQTIKASIVIPHFQDRVNLDQCLDLLSQQTLARSEYEIIVSENGFPEDWSDVKLCIKERATFVICTERGAGPARNAGVVAAKGSVLVFVDSDCRPEPNFLAEGLEVLKTNDFAGGSVRVDVANVEHVTPTEAFELVFAFRNDVYIRQKGFSVSAALFVPRKVFEAVGPFENGLSEDMEWCHRAVKKGYTLGYAERAIVGHPARRNWLEIEKKWRRLTAESFGIMRRLPFGLVRWFFRSWLIPLSIFPHTILIFSSPKLKNLRERIGALGVLLRLRMARLLWSHLAMFSRL
jgi:GT2 family glycosyltransferase